MKDLGEKEPSSASVKATGQKPLSLILDEIEARTKEWAAHPKADLRYWSLWISELHSVMVHPYVAPLIRDAHNKCQADNVALVKALRRAIEMLEWTMCRSEPGLLAHRKKEITAILTESDKASGE